jgi:hypothetical protein
MQDRAQVNHANFRHASPIQPPRDAMLTTDDLRARFRTARDRIEAHIQALANRLKTAADRS